MLRFALSRILMAVPTLLIVAVAVFVMIRLIPGDPAQLLLGDLATPAALADLRARLGLDQTWAAQFGIWFSNMLHGDLGSSINTGQPVLSLVWDRFLVSGRVVVVAVILAALVAVPAGMIAAWKQNQAADLALVSTATLLVSIPTFWLGLLMLILFGLKLQWLPVVGYVSVGEDWKAGLLYLIMPIATLFLHEIGVLLRMARASTLEVLRLDYITHARQGPAGIGGADAPRVPQRLWPDLDADRAGAGQSAGRHRRGGNRVHHSRPGPAAGGRDLCPRLSGDPGLPAVRGRGLCGGEPADRPVLSHFRPRVTAE